MNNKKSALAIVMFFLIPSIALGQQAPYDYNNENSYSDQNFLANSDASKWDFSKVDWNNPSVFNNPKVYNEIFKREPISADYIDAYSRIYESKAFYEKLPNDRYGSLDYRRV